MVKTCLEVMDYHYPIYKVKMLTPPGTSVSGEFIPEVSEYEEIKGHWEDVTYEMISRAPEGIYNEGDRMFYSGINLQPRDKLIMKELNGGTTKWEVQGRNQKLPYWDKLKVRRYSYHLKQVQIDEDFTFPEKKVSEGLKVSDETPIDQLHTDPASDPVTPVPDPAPPENIDPVVPEQPPEWTPSWMED